MGKVKDLFKKIRDTKGTLHAKMGTIKDRNSMHLTEAEDIKKTWQEYWSGLLRLNMKKTKITASSPLSSWQIEGGKVESDRFYFLGLQNHCRW